jgi:hypothetical protein
MRFPIKYKKSRELQQENLNALYKESDAYKRTRSKIEVALTQLRLRKNIKNRIMNKLCPFLISPGVKSKIRGDIFNKLVFKGLLLCYKKCGMSKKRYAMFMEKRIIGLPEIPDWYIHDKKEDRYLVGYNQIDLWSGGHQLNRGSKYILDDYLHRRLQRKNIRVVCVVEEEIPTKMTKSSKKYHIIHKGISTGRMCHLNGLVDILRKFSLDNTSN